jgi:fengycin family lipopeptide synthetase D
LTGADDTGHATVRVPLPPEVRIGPGGAGDALDSAAVLAAAVCHVLGAAERTDAPTLAVRLPHAIVSCAVDLTAVNTVGELRAATARWLLGSPDDHVPTEGAVVIDAASAGPAVPDCALLIGIEPGHAPGTAVLRADVNTAVAEPWFCNVFLRAVAAVLGRFADENLGIADLPVGAPDDIQAATSHGQAGFCPTEPDTTDSTLIEPIRSVVRAAPDRIAVRCDGTSLTYSELWARSVGVATRLAAAGVGAGQNVGLLTGKSPNAVPAILGTLIAGAAYVPLDPGAPAARLHAILADAGCRIVVAEASLRHLLDESDSELTVLDAAATAQPVARTDESTEPPPPQPDDRAYVIYTSGSTGTPKGVVIRHRAIAGYLAWKRRYHDIGADTRLLQIPSLAFDSSVSDVFSVLGAGGEIVLADIARPDPARIADMAARHGITHVTMVPSLYQVLLDHLVSAAPSLRLVTIAGEAVPPGLVARHHALAPSVRLVNEYGPTENSVGTTAFDHRPGDGPGYPIGRPVDTTVIAVADDRGRLLPPGFVGEIRLAGPALADGYLGRPELTAASFPADPAAPGGRWYRTGDRGWWRPDGVLEFAGRDDGQVKIRGYRVELGEVEAVLTAHGDVTAAAVVAAPGPDGRMALIAYVTGAADPEHVRERLRDRLPAQMLPSRIVVLAELPRLVSGKVDRAGLAARPVEEPASASAAPEAPREDEAAETVAAAFRDVLGIDELGDAEDFFALGGHSLLIVDLIETLTERTGVVLDLAAVFAAPTIRALADQLRATAPGPHAPAAPLSDLQPTDLPLLPVQRRMWLDERIDPARARVHHLTEAFLLTGDIDDTDVAAAVAAELADVEALALRVVLVGGEPRQRIDPQPVLGPRLVDLRGAADTESAVSELIAGEYGDPFDLTTQPPIRTVLARTAADERLLVITTHHIACDGESATLLVRRIFTAIAARRADADPPGTTILPTHYRDHVAWATAPERAAELAEARRYWTAELAAPLPYAAPPADGPCTGTPGPAQRLSVAVDAAATAELRRVAARRGATMFALTLSAALEMLHRVTGLRRVQMGTPVSLRGALPDGLIGPLLNTVVITADVADTEPFATLVERVQGRIAAAMAHRALDFGEMIDLTPGGRAGVRTPLFTVMFTLDEAGAAGTGSGDRFDLGPGVDVRRVPSTGDTGEFDISLHVDNSAAELVLTSEYDSDLYSAARTERVLRLWAHLLSETAANPDRTPAATVPPERELITAAALARSAPNCLVADASADPGLSGPVAVVDADGRPALCGAFGDIVEMPAGRPTGLTGRWAEDGSLVVAGPAVPAVADINGPVDPRWAQTRLAGHPDVAAALVRPAADGTLDAFVWLETGRSTDPAALRAHVRAVLPDRLTPRQVLISTVRTPQRHGFPDPAALPGAHEPVRDAAAPTRSADALTDAVARATALALGRTAVGPHDDFFELGGASLAALQLVGEIHRRFGVDLPPVAVFEARTPSALADTLRRHAARSGPARERRRAGTGPYPVTVEQRELLAALATADPAAFTVVDAARIGDADPDRLREALTATVRRHPALHYRLVGSVADAVWTPVDQPRIGWSVVDLADHDDADLSAAVDELIERHLGEPFDLAAGLLVRALLIRVPAADDVFVLAVHHIAVDGDAVSLLAREVAARYDGSWTGPADPDAPTAADVAHREHDRVSSDEMAAELGYWRDRLDRAAADPLPADRPRLLRTAVLVEQTAFQLPTPTGGQVAAFSARFGCSTFMTLVGAVCAAVADIQPDLSELRLATTISLRDEPGLLDTVALLSTTAVLSVDLTGRPEEVEYVRRVRDVLLDAHRVAVPFGLVAADIERHHRVDRADLARVLIVAQGGSDSSAAWRPHPVRWADRPLPTTYDLVLSLGLDGDTVDGWVAYKGELFDAATVDRLLRGFATAVDRVVGTEE